MDELTSKPTKELKKIAKENNITIVGCLEKSEIVNAIMAWRKEFIRGTKTETSSKRPNVIVIESESSHELSSTSMDESGDSATPTSKRAHRRTNNKSRRKSNISMWDSVPIRKVDKLPYDIDGLVAFQLPFDPKERMKSTMDGRSWSTWVTSNRKGFNGVRRSARCKGGYECQNKNCLFLEIYGKENKVQFETDENGSVICITCSAKGVKVDCTAQKIWEFDTSEDFVTVYHHGTHSCKAKHPIPFNDEGLRRKFSENAKATPKQAADEIIVEALHDEDMTWDDVEKVVDSVIEEGKVRYCKQKIQKETNPFGHSFEAVAELRRRLIDKDPFLVYKINNRNMNGEPSYVFKMSKVQAKLAVAMDCNENDFLANEYCFFDGTFKRCPGFVTLGAHVYVEMLRRIVKIATMECESESKEMMVIFWSLLNEVLEKFTGRKDYKFNPIGWIVDEHGGNWASIRTVYGEEAVKRTASCEFHFKQSVLRQSKHLTSSKSQTEFKIIAGKLLSSVTEVSFYQAYDELKGFINKEPRQRAFLKSWLEWWHERRQHFARAFKPISASSVNMSEAYHSTYVTTGSKGLKLVDAAYKDTASALRLERSLKLFGEGVKCQGSGPSGTKRREKDYHSQSKRASEYADVLLQESTSNDDGEKLLSEELLTKTNKDSSSSDSEVETKKRRKSKETDRNKR